MIDSSPSQREREERFGRDRPIGEGRGGAGAGCRARAAGSRSQRRSHRQEGHGGVRAAQALLQSHSPSHRPRALSAAPAAAPGGKNVDTYEGPGGGSVGKRLQLNLHGMAAPGGGLQSIAGVPGSFRSPTP